MKEIKVLIADDVEETRKNIRLLLELDQMITVVGEAGNGREAVELTNSIQPDVVLMDINMPDVDGIKATEAISVATPQVAVIIVSVQGEQEYLKRAMLAGAKEYLISLLRLMNYPQLLRGWWNCTANGGRNWGRWKHHQRLKTPADGGNGFQYQGWGRQDLYLYQPGGGSGPEHPGKVGLVSGICTGDVAVMMNIFPNGRLPN